MALHSPRFRLFALIMAVLLALPIIPATPTRAQGGSRTFPETGKTVSGLFLQYWDGHGGLAQQGFPISQEIQETSDTNGKIYTVQYFERAVFEHHPENAGKPSEVLLQLLGGFLYRQKYPQGAPGAAPNQSAGSRLFTETGKRLGGIFLQYWNTHGGLAQQGFPISDEFDEKSDLDGKTYKVQYFERAVFEYHPDQQPPYNVLLSQLGTFRYKAKYGALSHQITGGTGDKVTAAFPLKAGLAVLQSVRASAGGYFYINLVSAAGENLVTIASASKPADYSHLINIPADGMYALDVGAEEAWTVNIWQPKGNYTPPPAQQKWSGSGWQATPLFSLKAGQATFRVVGASEENATAALFDQNGIRVEGLAAGQGSVDVTTTVDIPADGVYIIQSLFEGDWSIEVQQ